VFPKGGIPIAAVEIPICDLVILDIDDDVVVAAVPVEVLLPPVEAVVPVDVPDWVVWLLEVDALIPSSTIL
jgi:hypothetical protein